MIVFQEMRTAWDQTRAVLFSGFRPAAVLRLGAAALLSGAWFLWVPLPGLGWRNVSRAMAEFPLEVGDLGRFTEIEALGRILAEAAGPTVFLWLALVYLSSVLKFDLFRRAVNGSSGTLRGAFARDGKNGLKVALLFACLDTLLAAFLFRWLLIPLKRSLLGGVDTVSVDGLASLWLAAALILLVRWLTVDFLVPLMAEGRGFGEAVAELGDLLAERWTEFAVYALWRPVLKIGGLVAALIVFVPFLLVGVAAGAVFLSALTALEPVPAALVAVPFLLLGSLLLLYLFNLIFLPAAVFLRCYSARVLQRCAEKTLDLPEVLY